MERDSEHIDDIGGPERHEHDEDPGALGGGDIESPDDYEDLYDDEEAPAD